jgi:hypothetical protein
MTKEPKSEFGRRDFLRTFGMGATATVAASASLTGEARADSESTDEKRKARYKESDHVKTYYSVNRYPAK